MSKQVLDSYILSTFYYSQSVADNQFYWRLTLNHTKSTIAWGEGYVKLRNLIKGRASIITNVPMDNQYEVRQDKDGRQHFNLKAANGEIIARSKPYSMDVDIDEKIEEFKMAIASHELKPEE